MGSMNVSKDTQEVIISALLKNSYLFGICKTEMTDGYFSDQNCKIIYKALMVYYKKYTSTPSLNEILVVIEDCYISTVGVTLAEVKDTCRRLYAYEEQDESFIKDKITDFIRKVRSSSALNNFLNQIKSNPNLESDTIVNDLSKALEVQLSSTKVFSMNNLEQVKEARKSAVGTTDNSTIIKSIFDTLNGSLMFKGFQPGTVNMVVSPPGCFTGDTKVMTIDETSHTLEELYQNKVAPGIYGSDESGNIRVGLSQEVYLSDYVDELIELEIDNQYIVKCTLDHPFMMRNGEYKRADLLEVYDSLMPIKRNQYGYVVPVYHRMITRITRIKLEEKVPVYGIVDAKPFNNFALAFTDEEGIFVSNTGKSMYLINEGVNASRQGFDVLHIFIGDMVEYDGYIRYLSCASGYNQNSLIMMPVDKQQEVVKFCNQQYDNMFNRIFILAYPSLTITVDQLMEDIIRFEKQLSKDFGMIVIDYPDNLLQEGKSLYEDGGTLYSSLEKLARLTKAVVLVASQPQKLYWGNEIIPLEAAAESSKKQMCVDVMITMNTAYRGANHGSILLAKTRKGEVGKIMRFKTDYAKCKIEEINENEYNILKSASKK